MKSIEYWTKVLEQHQAELSKLGAEMAFERTFTHSVLPLHGLPRKRRQLRSDYNSRVMDRVRHYQQLRFKQLKLEQLIAYALERINAIEQQTIFDRLRRGGLAI